MAYGWGPYVSVAQQRAKAQKKMAQLRKKGKVIQPIEIQGNKIAKSFWGKAWCEHLESYSDYENRLPRGRKYARNGSVCHLEVKKQKIEAMVSGSSIYNVQVEIKALESSRWHALKTACGGKISSLLDLLRGSLSDGVMEIVTDRKDGLFPQPSEIKISCDCPDWAGMCKHVAAVLYGFGARLDHSPELLFLLRGVDHNELVDVKLELPKQATSRRAMKGNVSDIFGIDLEDEQDKVSLETPKCTTPFIKKSTMEKPFSITAKGVTKLRKKFEMSVTQFATLLNVTPATIKNWEAKSGALNLRAVNLSAVENAAGLNKEGAWNRLTRQN